MKAVDVEGAVRYEMTATPSKAAQTCPTRQHLGED